MRRAVARGVRSSRSPHSSGPPHPQPIAPAMQSRHLPAASHPDTSSPTLRSCRLRGCPSEGPRSPNAPGSHASVALPRRGGAGDASEQRRRGWASGGGERGAAGTGRAGCRGGPARGPRPPGARGEARRTRRTHPLLLPSADGRGGGGRGAVPELGRLPGSQQAPREPAGPLHGHGRRADLLRPERACRRPAQRRAPLPTAVQEAELGAVPPLFLAELARGGFFSPATPLPTPCSPQKLLDDFPNSALLPARAANWASGPGPAAAPLPRGARGARGAAAAHAPRRLSWPAGRGCPRHLGDHRRRGRACSGRRGAPGGACPGPRSPFGGLLQGSSGHFYRFDPCFLGLADGRVRSSTRPSTLRKGLVAGIRTASPTQPQRLLCPQPSLRALEQVSKCMHAFNQHPLSSHYVSVHIVLKTGETKRVVPVPFL